MSSNKEARKKLEELYGAECFIEKLEIRKHDKPRRYTGKGQMKKMKQLTYHHILERSKRRKSDSRKWSSTFGRESRMVPSAVKGRSKNNESNVSGLQETLR